MRRVLAAICLLLLMGLPARAEDERPVVWYFYESYCDSCHPEQEFSDSFRQITGDDLSNYIYRYYNVRTGSGMAAFEQATEQFSIDEEHQLLPLAIVDGRVYSGTASIKSDMPSDFLEREASTDSVIYYLYVPACESCSLAAQALDELPKELTIKRGDISFTSKVVIEKIDLSAQLGTAQALFEKYDVPEEDQMAPIVFLRERYYQGADDISRLAILKVKSGGAVGAQPIGEREADLSAVTLWGSVAAGLVGGLNPCALSMLLFFLTLLIAAGRSVRLYASAFLISKFVAYLLIGTALYGLFSLYNPVWLKPALRWAMTVLGVVLAAMNLMDALRARREQYGQIKNQLPAGLRRRLTERIRAALEAPGARLLPAVVLLGAMVAGGEFLCAGQVYLATLLTAVHSGAQPTRMAALLVAYCASFLLPSALLCALAARGRAMFGLSEWVRGRMPLIKLITAAAFIAIVALIWLT